MRLVALTWQGLKSILVIGGVFLNLNIIHKVINLIGGQDRHNGFLLLFLIVIGTVLEALSIGIIAPIFSLLSQDNFSTQYPQIVLLVKSVFGLESRDSYILIAVGFLVLFYLIKTIFLVYLALKQAKYSYAVQEGLSYRLFKMYLEQSFIFHVQRNTSELINNVLNEVAVFRDTVMLIIMFVAEILVIAGLSLLAIFIEPIGAIVVFVTLGFFSWIFQHVTKRLIINYGNERQESDVSRTLHLQHGLGSIQDIKLSDGGAEFLRRYKIHNLSSANAGMVYATLVQLPRLWLELICVVGFSLVIATMYFNEHSLVGILPSLGVFVAIAFRLLPSTNRVLGALQGIRYGMATINKLSAEIDLLQCNKESLMSTKKDCIFSRTIELQNICYRYPNTNLPAIEGAFLTIKKNQSIGIVGNSGAGKSTLINIILGLLRPESGSVLVDGQDISMMMSSWQRKIGYVPQSIFLTDDSIARNIAFGLKKSEIDYVRVAMVIKDAQLGDWVDQLPEGLNSKVGERGIFMSGGQRQRMGIARALYRDPSILVFDEATSSLDNESEQDVMRAINGLRNKKTIIIVTHRLSTLANCDELYKLQNGKLTSTEKIF